MDVPDILKIVANMSIGLDSPNPDDLAIFLKYLNLVHFELYRNTALTNPSTEIIRETRAVVDGVLEPLTQTPFSIRRVYSLTSNTILEPTSIDVVESVDPSNSTRGTPTYWYYANTSVQVYPIYTGDIGIIYVPEPTELLANTVSADIPYPAAYHQVLVDGTCYYLFQSESGFKNDTKMQVSLARWEKGRAELYSYLRNLSGKKTYSTFSVV